MDSPSPYPHMLDETVENLPFPLNKAQDLKDKLRTWDHGCQDYSEIRLSVIQQRSQLVDEISRAEDELKRMKLRYTQLGEVAEYCSSMRAPIRRLPMDVLQEIFSFHQHIYNEPSLKCHSAVTVAAVCLRWRAAALSFPRLWTMIAIRASPVHILSKTVDLVPKVKTFLQRSGSSPLSINIDGSYCSRRKISAAIDSAICLLIKHAHRWKSLHVQDLMHIAQDGMEWRHYLLKAPLPLLEEIFIERAGDSHLEHLPSPPNLRSFKLLNHWCDVIPPAFHHAWKVVLSPNETEECELVSELVRSIGSAQQLNHLFLDDLTLDCCPDPIEVPTKEVNCLAPRLTLKFADFWDEIDDIVLPYILQPLNTPNLTFLTLIGINQNILDHDFLPFMSNNKPPLKALYILNPVKFNSDHRLGEALVFASNISHLVLSDNGDGIFISDQLLRDLTVRDIDENRQMLPILQQIDLALRESFDSWDLLANMLESRLLPHGPIAGTEVSILRSAEIRLLASPEAHSGLELYTSEQRSGLQSVGSSSAISSRRTLSPELQKLMSHSTYERLIRLSEVGLKLKWTPK